MRGFAWGAACAAGLLLIGCAGGKGSTAGGGGGRAAHPAPNWFHNPPKGANSLFFVGDANGSPDEATARELAIRKAIAELTVYCGATVKSDFSSQEREANGNYQQVISMTVDIAGDEMTIREAVVKQTVVGQGEGGLFDGYALVEWPKAQYEAVLAAQRQRAQRALIVYLEAEAAANQNRVGEAKAKNKEAKTILGPMKSQVPLPHDRFTNSTLLWDAVSVLDERLAAKDKERKKVMAVNVLCAENGKNLNCKSERVGNVRQRVAAQAFKVSAESVADATVQEILASGSPQGDTALRSAGFALAVSYDANLTAMEDGFTFVHCGARAVVYDTDANRIISVKEVKPEKGGHVHFQGAVDKACGTAEKAVLDWIGDALPPLAK